MSTTIILLVFLAILIFCATRTQNFDDQLWEGELRMSKTLQAGASTTGTVAYTNKDGGPATPASPPQWSVSPDGVVTLTPAADGMSCGIVAGTAPGTATVSVVAEGDPTPGVDTITLAASISVVPEEASAGTLTFN